MRTRPRTGKDCAIDGASSATAPDKSEVSGGATRPTGAMGGRWGPYITNGVKLVAAVADGRRGPSEAAEVSILFSLLRFNFKLFF